MLCPENVKKETSPLSGSDEASVGTLLGRLDAWLSAQPTQGCLWRSGVADPSISSLSLFSFLFHRQDSPKKTLHDLPFARSLQLLCPDVAVSRCHAHCKENVGVGFHVGTPSSMLGPQVPNPQVLLTATWTVFSDTLTLPTLGDMGTRTGTCLSALGLCTCICVCMHPLKGHAITLWVYPRVRRKPAISRQGEESRMCVAFCMNQ